jgi:hypothetical protein
MTPSIAGKPLTEMTHDELELNLLVELSCKTWHDLSNDIPDPDPEAIQSYGWGRKNGGFLHVLTRYKNDEVCLVSARMGQVEPETGWKRTNADQFKLMWLWNNVCQEEHRIPDSRG